jgi:hypothetical protein
MKCVCPMGGDRTCPDDCLIAVWHNLAEDQRTKDRRRPMVETLRKQGYTQDAIAMQLGVTQQTISNDLKTLQIVCNVEERGKDTLGRKRSTGRPKSTTRPERRKNTSATAEAAALLVIDEGKSYVEVEKETGVSNTVLRSAVAREEGRRDPQIDPDSLSKSVRKKFDAAIRQHQRKLDAEFSSRVSEEIKRVLDQWLPEYHEKLAQAERALNAYQGIMSRAQFRLLLACLSPDSRKGFTDQKFNEAFNIVKKLEVMLVKKDEQNNVIPSSFQFPRTYEEAIKMKQHLRAQRKAKKSGNTIQLA